MSIVNPLVIEPKCFLSLFI